jgi:RimJ/RimL family protein N-acetyltransferase
MIVRETSRLVLRRLTADDAAFIVELLNDPAWLQFIGDRGVRTTADALAYLQSGPMAMYARLGFGLFAVAEKNSGRPTGLCGLLQRETLPDVDLGFAFLPEFRGRGMAREAAEATIALARDELHLRRLVALTHPQNLASIGLLGKLGFGFEQLFRLAPDQPESKLFGRAL